MEYRDLYDENRNLTEKKILKGDIVPKSYYYITVVIIIENSNKELLLQINKKYNMWSFTGGHPKSGENSVNGAITELKEELGINVNLNELKLFHTIKTEDDFIDLYCLKKDIEINDLTLQKEEVGLIKWYSYEEVEKIINENKLLPSHKEFYDKYLAFINGYYK